MQRSFLEDIACLQPSDTVKPGVWFMLIAESLQSQLLSGRLGIVVPEMVAQRIHIVVNGSRQVTRNSLVCD